MADVLGKGACPCCGGSVIVKLTVRGLASLTCNWCMLQVFARGPDSDQWLRGQIGKTPTRQPRDDDPAPARTPPAADLVPELPADPPAPAVRGMGLLTW